jgi:hypothetical protein
MSRSELGRNLASLREQKFGQIGFEKLGPVQVLRSACPSDKMQSLLLEQMDDGGQQKELDAEG